MQAPRPAALAFSAGIEQAELKRAGLAGGDERCGAHGAAAAAVAARGKAVAGNEEGIADRDGAIRRGERRRRKGRRQRRRELEQRHIGGGAVRRAASREIELGMARDGRDVAQPRIGARHRTP